MQLVEPDPDPDESPDRAAILILSLATFLGCCTLGFAGCWLAKLNLAELMQPSWNSLANGLTISVPLFVMLAVVRVAPFEWARRLWDTPERLLGSGLTELSVLDVASVALMAGVGEELLFRGFLQGWLTAYGLWWGLIVPNLLFGLLHAMTPAYAGGAFLVGLSFSCLLHFSAETNLTSLMAAHAMYDFVAWQWMASRLRSKQGRLDGGSNVPD